MEGVRRGESGLGGWVGEKNSQSVFVFSGHLAVNVPLIKYGPWYGPAPLSVLHQRQEYRECFQEAPSMTFHERIIN